MKRGLIALLALAPISAAPAEPKNILLIIADDYGVDSSALYNSTNSGASLPRCMCGIKLPVGSG